MSENLATFYESMRWPGWEQEASALNGDQGFSVYPFLWTNAEIPFVERSRRTVPMIELSDMQQKFAQQL